MIMSEEAWKAWMKMQHFCYELNMCFQEQYPWEEIYNSDEELFARMETFDEILDELCSQFTRKVKV